MELLWAFLVLALPFITIANCAPEPVVLNPFDVLSNVDAFRNNIECIYHAVDEAFDETDVDDLWHNAKIQLKSIVEIEWSNCSKMADEAEREKCKSFVLGHGVHVVTKFANQLVYDHKLQMDWHKLRTEIAAKCFQERTFIE